MKNAPRNLRSEEIFNRWLTERRYRKFKETLIDFRVRCDAGEVPGLGYDDFTVSDTATGGAETPEPEKRDDVVASTPPRKPSSAAEQLGPSEDDPTLKEGVTYADVFDPGREPPF